MLNNYQIKKKEHFINSIEPLSKNYFIFFMIWRLSVYNFYQGFIFLDKKYQKKIRKNLKKFADKSQNNYIIISFFALIVGFSQIFYEYTGMPVFDSVKNNLPIYNTNKFSYNWKTFHILNSSNLIRHSPLSYQYKKIHVLNNSIKLQLNSFYQNQKNKIFFGHIPLKPSLLNNGHFYFFEKNRYMICLKHFKIRTLDTIPQKMESISGQKQAFFDLFDENNNIEKTTFLSFGKESFTPRVISKQIKKRKYNLGSKLKLVKKNNQNLVWKNPFKFRKSLKIKNKKIKKFALQNQLKSDISKIYRDFFYQDELKNVDPKFFKLTEITNIKKPNLVLKKIIKNQINYLDILKLINENEISFINENIKPRHLSGYWFPDSRNNKKFNLFSTNPASIQVNLPGKYKSFFIESFSKTIRKQRRFLKSKNNFNFDKLHDNILYLNFQNPLAKVQKNKTYKNYRKRLTIYEPAYINQYSESKSNNLEFVSDRIVPKTLGLRNYQFDETREPLKTYSWLIVTKVGVAVIGFRLLQYLYQEYGKEILLSLINFISLIGILDSEWLIDELNLSIYSRGYRAVRRVKKSFRQAAGITSLMAHFSEVLWQLKSQNTKGTKLFHIFNYSLSQNRSFILEPALLIGAPGTGKTLLVQALAGEAGVPVLLQSGSVLKDFRQRGKGARSIQNLFRRARRITPCIVFIDEVDGVGVRRESLSLNPMGEQDVLDSINEAGSVPVSFEDLKNFKPKSKLKDLFEEEEILELDRIFNYGETITETAQKNELRIKVLQEEQTKRNARTEQISILIQLLIELDGLNPLNDIMVFGATNRPQILDPALLRPGRFYKIIKLKLPDQRKRIQILKLYISHMKKSSSVPWYYFSQRMEGFSAADIAAVVNESALISISNNKPHTLKSLEEGLDRVTSYSVRKNSFNAKRKLYYAYLDLRSRWLSNELFANKYKLTRKASFPTHTFLTKSKISDFLYSIQYRNIAYYQAGKSITEIILPKHPANLYFAIKERIKNFRYMATHGLVLSLMEDLKFCSELEERLVGLLSGKASEFLSGYASIVLHLKNILNRPGFNVSSLGWDNTQSATLLSFLMVEKWYLYAKRTCTQAFHPLLNDLNLYEFYQEDINLFKAIVEDIESQMDTENRLFSILKTQKWSYRSWWQKQLADEEGFFEKNKSAMDWYRIYLAEPEEEERNIEWVPPDDYYTNLNIRLTNSNIYWQYFLKLTYDHLYHSLLINSFNVSYSILNKNRELLDYLVDFVLRYEKVRNHQIKILISPFININQKLKTNIFSVTPKSLNKEKIVIFKSWGSLSNRRTARVLNINQLIKDYPAEEDLKDKILESFQKLDIPAYLIKYRLK